MPAPQPSRRRSGVGKAEGRTCPALNFRADGRLPYTHGPGMPGPYTDVEIIPYFLYKSKAPPPNGRGEGMFKSRAVQRNIVDDLTGADQAGYGGDIGVAAGDLAALGTLAGRAGRADAVCAAADGHIIDGRQRLFL